MIGPRIMNVPGEYARLHATVQGVVQGVGYRYFVQALAQRLECTGWVCNRADGSVELEVEGTSGALSALVDELKVGPVSADVRSVQVQPGTYRAEFDRFEIRF